MNSDLIEMWLAITSASGLFACGGVASEWQDYYCYGAARDGASWHDGRWQYLAAEADHETGTLRLQAREYLALEGFSNKPDRFESKYPALSPYGYGRQNPFKYADPSGDTIKIVGDEKFVEQVQKLIAILKESDEDIKKMIEDLESSQNIHYILPWDKKRTANEVKASDGKWQFASGKKKDENHIPTGTMIFFNPFSVYPSKESEKSKDSKDKRHPAIGLGHELSHAYDTDKGQTNFTTIGMLPMFEIDAINVENRVRFYLGEPMRTDYSGIKIDEKYLKLPPKLEMIRNSVEKLKILKR